MKGRWLDTWVLRNTELCKLFESSSQRTDNPSSVRSTAQTCSNSASQTNNGKIPILEFSRRWIGYVAKLHWLGYPEGLFTCLELEDLIACRTVIKFWRLAIFRTAWSGVNWLMAQSGASRPVCLAEHYQSWHHVLDGSPGDITSFMPDAIFLAISFAHTKIMG